MKEYYDSRLAEIQRLIDNGLDKNSVITILKILGISYDPIANIEQYRLWTDYMPLADTIPYTDEQRYLHILWELLDKSPLGINCNFAIPFRAMIAKKLFKKCGEGFVCAENCRFNFGNNIVIGDNVSWNQGCYIDSKGGVEFEDYAMLTEYVKIFSHGHSEVNHLERSYKPVKISKFAKVYTNATILPGVTIGKGAIVATGAIVTKSVEDYTLVGGIPAKPMRSRQAISDDENIYNQYMMKEGFFQIK